jgi:uncharacterized protein YkwD
MARAWIAPAGGRIGAGTALVALTLGVSLLLAAQSGMATALASCPHATAHPHTVSLAKLRNAMTCLVNQKRAKHGRQELKPNDRLQRAATRHTKVMLEKDCFEHRCPGEPTLSTRVKQSGYIKGAKAWRFAEDLGVDHSPRQMIRRLMHSHFNRSNILNRDFRDIGIGVGWGSARAGQKDWRFETFTLVFGWRRP